MSQLLFGVGTLAYSIVFVTYGVVPEIIGWLGLVAGILVSFANVLKLLKHNFKVLEIFGALSAILFEVIFGGWLLFSSII